MIAYAYLIVAISFGGNVIKRTDSDGTVTWIPEDPANSDYQAYLASLK
jgi:hypothetical protein